MKPDRRTAFGAGVLSAAAFVLSAGNANAWCRSHTCEDEPGRRCEREGACIVEGHALFRRNSCTSYAIQESASQPHGIDAKDFNRVVREAFDRWLDADCGKGRRPSIDVLSLGAVQCDEVEYNTNNGNVSVFVFRDDWSHLDVNAYALTTVFFETTTGEIYDADVEINGTEQGLVISAPEDGVDLGSIVTHEVGHFLGLSHSEDPTAVMRPEYLPVRDNLRELRADDVQGICEIYPPDRKTESDQCAPRHGFAKNCRFEPLEASGGCAQAPGSSSVTGAALGGLLVALTAFFRRSRKRRELGRADRPR